MNNTYLIIEAPQFNPILLAFVCCESLVQLKYFCSLFQQNTSHELKGNFSNEAGSVVVEERVKFHALAACLLSESRAGVVQK